MMEHLPAPDDRPVTPPADPAAAPPGLAEAAALARAARRVVVLSGAGMSAESGVPTFREARTGLWERFSPEELASEDAWYADPALVWAWYRWRARLVRSCAPNAGHRAIARWQRALAGGAGGAGGGGGADGGGEGGSLAVATQNVDDLHERAGTAVLAHLHGSLFDYRCADCGAPAELDRDTADGTDSTGDAGEADGGPAPGSEADLERVLRVPPPACPACGTGLLRPGIVWFGEMLPRRALDETYAALERCDLAVVVGTSATVQPAATLPYVALGAGAAVVEVNPEVTEFSTAATVHVRGTAAAVLPVLAGSIPEPGHVLAGS
ncbi:NAD-dependent deacylase [Citricoccus sp. SGAir0253]|uniref:NAD-dependent deacylase n=1 Tax=Citricoccus sp. SGAir0253 TaxID=2567881 RepID=UPI0010CD6987|nr:NAD-dependent deacylase [Citricoccus sp. SGAir0253]QCU78562.1 NAD-dependent deacylase [Citricoccus sp. SGAir0253]